MWEKNWGQGWNSKEDFENWIKQIKFEAEEREREKKEKQTMGVKEKIKEEKEREEKEMYRSPMEKKRYEQMNKEVNSLSGIAAARRAIQIINSEGEENRASAKMSKFVRDLGKGA